MSDENWDEPAARYESRSLFSSGDHLDNTPLLADDAYSEIATHNERVDGVEGHERAWHCHWRGAPEPPDATRQLVMALALCGMFMLCELIGGYVAGSLAVMCDAAHLLSDCGGFGLALLALRLAGKPSDSRMSYGYRRAEVLGGAASVLVIWLLTGVLVYVASLRLHTGDYDVEPDRMMLVAGLGVAVNVAIALVLRGCCAGIAHHHSHGAKHTHSHSHNGHDSDKYWMENPRLTNGSVANGTVDPSVSTDALTSDTVVRRKTNKNINLRAALIHVLGDLIQSCGVFLASLIIKFFPEWKVMDPICTFVFSLVVLTTTAPVVKDALAVLMQAVPDSFRYRECLRALQSIGGVRGVHSFHAWGLSTHTTIVTGHVLVDNYADSESILRQCVDTVRRHGADAATLQLERDTGDACAACRQTT